MKRHFWILVACLLPVTLIYSVPSLSTESNALLALLLIGCFLLHLALMKSLGQGSEEGKRKLDD